MLTVTINQEQIEHELESLARHQHKSPDELVRDAVAQLVGLPHLSKSNHVDPMEIDVYHAPNQDMYTPPDTLKRIIVRFNPV